MRRPLTARELKSFARTLQLLRKARLNADRLQQHDHLMRIDAALQEWPNTDPSVVAEADRLDLVRQEPENREFTVEERVRGEHLSEEERRGTDD